MTDVIEANARGIDLSPRMVVSTVVVASPSANAETIIGSVTLPSGLTIASGVWLQAWAAFTVGTSGTAVTLRIRQTTVAGSVVVTSGALTSVAANVNERSISAFDTAPADGQVYKFTMTVTGGAAASTVSALTILALAI